MNAIAKHGNIYRSLTWLICSVTSISIFAQCFTVYKAIFKMFVLTIALLGKKREFYFPQFVNKKRGKVTVA